MRLFLAGTILLIAIACKAQSDPLQTEKANFLLNITRYVRWNDRNHIGKTFDIGVVRSKAMTKELRKLSYKKTILGKKIKIIEYYKLDEIEGCDLIFLSNQVYINDKTILIVKENVSKSTLIVTDNAPRVGMINFFVQPYDGILTFEVNQKNIERANITPLSGFIKNKKTRVKNDEE